MEGKQQWLFSSNPISSVKLTSMTIKYICLMISDEFLGSYCRFICDSWDEPLYLLLFGYKSNIAVQIWLSGHGIASWWLIPMLCFTSVCIDE